MPFLRRKIPLSELDLPLMIAKGSDGQLERYANKARIKRKNEEKDILLSNNSSIQLSRAGLIFPGFMELTFSGGQEQLNRANENAIWFRRRQQRQFEQFKNELDKRATTATTGGS